ncbi:hypothetical protein [Mycolicibacterium arenosum]|uniref:Uncharacterized protein n=1 Tax=Mycolicibacterium arenosum TaxID=2952157 RepID=A0ABT1MCS9_9MYCO|nr:hypothetical protein [Mycolicibacterium sp. CAU 1645]MCP9276984.1 hypothetical protein [Mycolicibacterium sp. CAU 1645]
MSGLASFAMAGAPIAGGALVGLLAGNLRGPDVRALIKQDMDLLAQLPPEQVERRAELQRVIDIRVDDIIAGVDKNRTLVEMAQSYRGNWRDIVVFICAVLFSIVWFEVADRAKGQFWPMFIVLILLSIVAGAYAGRGVIRALRSLLRHGDDQ